MSKYYIALEIDNHDKSKISTYNVLTQKLSFEIKY